MTPTAANDDGRTRRKQRWGMALAVVLLVALAFTISGVFPLRRIILTDEQVDRSRAQYEALVAENEQLDAEVADLKTDVELERIAREEYGLVAPGEVGYVVVPSLNERSDPNEPTLRLTEPRPWWERVWEFVSGGDVAGDG